MGVAGDVWFTDADDIRTGGANICKSGVFFHRGSEFAIDILEGVSEVFVGMDGVATGRNCGGVCCWWEVWVGGWNTWVGGWYCTG